MNNELRLLLVTCDDPSADSSSNEQDSRPFAKIADLPLLEPSTFQEAKEMAKWAFSLSEEIRNVVLMSNQYIGPKSPEVLIITCGTGWLYSQEALEMMGVEGRVGILKIGTTWPLPTRLIVENLARTDKILFVEEVDCFLEGNVKEVLG